MEQQRSVVLVTRMYLPSTPQSVYFLAHQINFTWVQVLAVNLTSWEASANIWSFSWKCALPHVIKTPIYDSMKESCSRTTLWCFPLDQRRPLFGKWFIISKSRSPAGKLLLSWETLWIVFYSFSLTEQRVCMKIYVLFHLFNSLKCNSVFQFIVRLYSFIWNDRKDFSALKPLKSSFHARSCFNILKNQPPFAFK